MHLEPVRGGLRTLSRHQVPGALLIAALATLTGCFDGTKARTEHVEQFQAAAKEAADRELAKRKSLSLDDCIDIALRNNLQLRQAEISARVAHLERLASFAAFLPVVEASGSMSTMDHQQMLKAGENPMTGAPIYMAMQDKNIEDAALRIQMPIFRPASWFLYSASKRGEEIASILKDYARQRITMEVTARYFHCLTLHEMEQSAQSRLAAARQFKEEVEALAVEGFADEVQVEEAKALLLTRQVEMERLRRSQTTANADLMVLLGFPPLTNYALGTFEPIKPPSGDLPELVTQALLASPQLKVSDRSVAISHDVVKASVANFLPSIVGTGIISSSSNSFMKYGTVQMAELSGFMTVFNGFANVQQYRIAKEQEKAAWLRREEASFAVMLQVVCAHASLRDAEQDEALAQKYLDVAAGRLRVLDGKWREGLATSSELLTAHSTRDEAAVRILVAKFRREVCTAALLHSMGQNTSALLDSGQPNSKR